MVKTKTETDISLVFAFLQSFCILESFTSSGDQSSAKIIVFSAKDRFFGKRRQLISLNASFWALLGANCPLNLEYLPSWAKRNRKIFFYMRVFSSEAPSRSKIFFQTSYQNLVGILMEVCWTNIKFIWKHLHDQIEYWVLTLLYHIQKDQNDK